MSLTNRQIAQQEQKARSRYLSAVRYMDNTELPSKFDTYLDQKILPLLGRVGFDQEIARNIFTISAHAWNSLGPFIDDKLRLHPSATRDITEIRQGIIAKTEKKAQKLSALAEKSSQELFRAADESMHPDKLCDLLQTIPVTWIILPRAHSLLKKDDSTFLAVYLRQLDRESNKPFELILARILIEFIGNYSLKYLNTTLPKKQMVEAIFYGYVTLFWKNLRQPPSDFEDLLLFRNYLSWARAFKKRAEHNDHEKDAAITQMEEMENRIFPPVNAFGLTDKQKIDARGFLITLRHGKPGIKSVINYFNINHLSPGPENLSCRSLPKEMSTLFRELEKNYNTESPRTTAGIHTFLQELKTIYGSATIPAHKSESRGNHATFTQGRMASLVNSFSTALH